MALSGIQQGVAIMVAPILILLVLVVGRVIFDLTTSGEDTKSVSEIIENRTSLWVKTIEHDDHLFVLFDGHREVAMLHHPSCLHSECLK